MKGATVVGLVLGLALAGACGGDEEPLTKSEYLERARTVCREGNEQLAAATREEFKALAQGEKPSPEQLERYARDVVVPMVRRQVESLRAIPGPKGDADQVDEIYDAFEAALDRIQQEPSLLTDNPNMPDVFKEADDLSRKYGYAVCT